MTKFHCCFRRQIKVPVWKHIWTITKKNLPVSPSPKDPIVCSVTKLVMMGLHISTIIFLWVNSVLTHGMEVLHWIFTEREEKHYCRCSIGSSPPGAAAISSAGLHAICRDRRNTREGSRVRCVAAARLIGDQRRGKFGGRPTVGHWTFIRAVESC